MAHNLEVKNGKASFLSYKQDAWHILGDVEQDYSTMDTWEKVYQRSQANYEIGKFNIPNTFTDEDTDFFGLYRMDNYELLCIVGADYEVIQNKDVFKTFNVLVGDNFRFETAGVLGKGEQVFVSASIGSRDFMGSGDIHLHYLCAVTSHNKTLSNIYKMTDTRVVCANTLSMALNGGGKEAKVIHSKGANQRLVDVRAMLNNATKREIELNEKMEVLARREVNSEIVNEALAKCFEVSATKEMSDTQAKSVLKTMDLFESNDNNTFPEFKNTGYNLLNAITEFYDHHKGARSDYNRAKSAVLGESANKKNEMIEVLLELTNGQTMVVNQPKAYSITEKAKTVVSGDTSHLLNDILSDYN